MWSRQKQDSAIDIQDNSNFYDDSLGFRLSRLSNLSDFLLHFSSKSTTEQCLLAELAMLKDADELAGIYVMPLEDCILHWEGCIFPSLNSPYQDGVYRFVIDIDFEYPKKMPIIRITSPIAHPLIDSLTGRLDTRFSFSTSWNEFGLIQDLLLFLKLVLDMNEKVKRWIYEYYEDRFQVESLKNQMYLGNQPGVAFFLESMETGSREFEIIAKECASASNMNLYDNADSHIVFTPWDLIKNEDVLDLIKEEADFDSVIQVIHYLH
jgi:ubiquitin-protein ligase